MTFINLTPHAIVVRTEGGDVTFPPSGQVARVATAARELTAVDGIRIFSTVFGEVSGIPASAPGMVFIASSLVGQAAQRADVVAPLTDGSAIRDDKGRIVAVLGFQTFTPTDAE